MAIQDRIERGEDPREAEDAARREFGNGVLVRETTRAMWGSAYPEQVLQDIGYALRSMRRKPGVTAVIVASLALGIGANVALFSLAYALLLRSLPVSHPGQLVELLQKYPGEPRGNGYWTTPSYEFYRDHNHVFSGLTGSVIDHVTRVDSGSPDAIVVVGEAVSGNYFPLLAIQPALGRLIGPEHSQDAVAVLSWDLWSTRFGKAPSVLGRRILVNDAPATVIGVAPRGYTGLLPNAQTSVWTPVKSKGGLNLIARLKPGVTIEQARAEMKLLYRFTIEERSANSKDPQVKNLEIQLESARAGLGGLRDRVGRPLTILMGLVAVLLMLACVNVAGILLAQAAAREQEMALRSGLGASRGRLVRQVLTEACLLSVGATTIGLGVAYLGTTVLLRILDSGRPHERIRLLVDIDSTVVLFTAAIAIGTGVLFGLAPAVHALRAARLQHASSVAQTRSHRLFGQVLAATQVALALVLLSFGALFTATLSNLKGKDLGFRHDHVLLAALNADRSGYRGERLANVMHELLNRLRSIPGVQVASLGAPTPLMGAGASAWMTAEGFGEEPANRRRISISWVAPQYFEAMRIPLLAGRDFNSGDEATAKVAIISKAAARYYFGERNPIGRRVTLDQVTNTRDPAIYEVIGVAGDANYREIRETDRRSIYLSAFGPRRVTAQTFVLQTAASPESIGDEVSRVIRETAPALPAPKIVTLSAQIDSSIMSERLMATLSGFFAGIGGLLAGIGVYGLLAYTVARRTKEIGVRVALGATSGRVLGMVLGEAVVLVLAGLAAGVPLAVWSRSIATQVVEDLSMPPAAALGAGVIMLLAIAAIASAIPARNATPVDAMQSLRHD